MAIDMGQCSIFSIACKLVERQVEDGLLSGGRQHVDWLYDCTLRSGGGSDMLGQDPLAPGLCTQGQLGSVAERSKALV